MLLYTDLDNTLINPITDREGNVIAIIPRPGVHEFIEKLSRDGRLWMLTAAVREHAERALSILGPSTAKRFQGILSREDMEPIEEQLNAVFSSPGLTDNERLKLLKYVRPIAPPGAMFDNYPVGSSIYFLKASSLGIGPDQWIEVDHFGDGKIDRGGLSKAYSEFRRRFPHRLLQMDGKRKRAVIASKIF